MHTSLTINLAHRMLKLNPPDQKETSQRLRRSLNMRRELQYAELVLAR